ncbi:MAG: hypothetical protein S4CHLAM123_03550 [Chlamydiales bacterium]|nr:hypothetical protein [Chlamydiales bacterium]
MASFISEKSINNKRIEQLGEVISQRFKSKKIHAFVNISQAEENVSHEMRQMLKYYGLGPLKPNTVIFGSNHTKSEAQEFSETIKCALNRRYNVVIVNDEKDPIVNSKQTQGKNDIHAWWDDKDEDSSELMLVFAYMMQRNPNRKKCTICLKAIVTDERARQAKIQFFRDLSLRLRLPTNIDVYVSPEPENVKIQFAKSFSSDADIIFMPLKSPDDEMISSESYSEYLSKISKVTDDNPSIVLVLSSDHTPLESILL